MFTSITKKKLGEIALEIKRGISSYYIGKEGQKENFISIKDIKNGLVEMGEVEKMTIKSTNSTKKSQLEANDLVLAVKGSNYKCGIVEQASAGSYISSNLIGIKLKSGFNPRLILEYLNSSFGQRELSARASGGFQKSLSIKSILDIEIPIFSKEKENALMLFFDLNKKLINLNDRELEIRRKLNNEIIGELLKCQA